MSANLAIVNVSTDTFSAFFSRINNVISTMNTIVITTSNSTSNVSLTNGYAFVNGSIGSNVVYATTFRGGNASASGNTTFASNVAMTGNSFSFSTDTIITLGSQLTINATTLKHLYLQTGNNILAPTYFMFNTKNVTNIMEHLELKVDQSAVSNVEVLNFKSGNNIDLNVSAPNVSQNYYTIEISIPDDALFFAAGSNSQIQFNNSAYYGASANLTFNRSTQTLATVNFTTSGNTDNGMTLSKSGTANGVSGNTTNAIDSWATGNYIGAEYLMQATVGANNLTSKFIVNHNNGTAQMVEYARIGSNNITVAYTATVTSGTLAITASTPSQNVVFKYNRILFKA